MEDALIRRFGALPRGDADVVLRTDNALVYASELYGDLGKFYGLHQEFILPHTPEQNAVSNAVHVSFSFSSGNSTTSTSVTSPTLMVAIPGHE